MKRLIKMDDRDTVATTLDKIFEGDTINIYNVQNELLSNIDASSDIPYGNKIALQNIEKGSHVTKYGASIGLATTNIRKGSLVHVHNVKSLAVDMPETTKKEILRQMKIIGNCETTLLK